jgi:hypothetical protein
MIGFCYLLLYWNNSIKNYLVTSIIRKPALVSHQDFGIRLPSGTSVTVEEFLQFEIDGEDRHFQQIREWIGDQ